MSDTPKKELETELIGGLEKRVIEIAPYRFDWPAQFQCHAERIKNALGETALRIEHIGSTSVEGLAAKPVIDILVVISNPQPKRICICLAYHQQGTNSGVREPEFDEHRMFQTPNRDIHVHFYPAESGEIEQYLLFRDFLRANPEACDRYAALKRELSNMDWADMNAYADAKTAFIEDIIRQVGTSTPPA